MLESHSEEEIKSSDGWGEKIGSRENEEKNGGGRIRGRDNGGDMKEINGSQGAIFGAFQRPATWKTLWSL
jgi:hypothetical protein